MMKKVLIFSLVIWAFGAQAQRSENISVERYYSIKKGNVWFKATRLMYGYQDGILYPQTETDTIYFYNDMDKPLEYSFERLPDFLSVQMIPNNVPANSEAKIAVAYDTKVKDTYGPTFDYFYMQTNDDQQPRKRLIVSPDIKEDFSILSDTELANAPVIAFDEQEYDFGTIQMGEKINHTFTFTNRGGRDLIIRNTKAGCGCTASEPDKKVLAPGEQGTIDVKFNSFGKKGKQYQRITIIANDPEQPETTLYLKGNVVKKEE
ncbi:MAG: DUF1573 domain-containing protein [Bacteroidales bacterium]|nr:DUF1573 domain-containing protein [Bacteroidales bacterium]